MHKELISILGITITGWKLVGYAGVCMFTGRWFVQMLASRKARKPVVPRLFWFLSMAGSLMCLSYFVFGKNDSVGVLGYLFPTAVSLYNLVLDARHRARLADSV
jgi:lipid-A-disaccharide synthase-like uncharacterized protein